MPEDGLLVFIDETGIEDFSDLRNPTFGRGGCAVLSGDYKRLLKKPWRRLKRDYLGGANKPFHATEFEQSRPKLLQITAINRFLKTKFWRFAVMCDSRTKLPEGVDSHRAVSLITVRFVERLVATFDVSAIALIFEASERGNELVKRDFPLAQMKLVSRAGQHVAVEGCFIEKKHMEAGLEVADLVAHTAGRQRRHQIAGKQGVTKDFEQMYWHSPIPPAFMAIDSVVLNELSVANSGAAETEDDIR